MITANRAVSNELIDFEVYNAAGTRVWQSWRGGVNFSANVPKYVVDLWATPSTLPAGTYTLKLGIFSSTWNFQGWSNRAATFQVS